MHVLSRCSSAGALRLTGAVALGCRSAVEKKTVLENLDLVLLVMDETVDGG
jgi:hypothetical protein